MTTCFFSSEKRIFLNILPWVKDSALLEVKHRFCKKSPLGVLSKWAFAVWSRPTASIAGLFVLLIATLAALAPLIAPTNPYDLATVSILDGRLPPGSRISFTRFRLLELVTPDTSFTRRFAVRGGGAELLREQQ